MRQDLGEPSAECAPTWMLPDRPEPDDEDWVMVLENAG